MPWVEVGPPCEHPGRPEPVEADEGKIWHCEDCDTRWQVVVVRMLRDGPEPGDPDVPYNDLLWELR